MLHATAKGTIRITSFGHEVREPVLADFDASIVGRDEPWPLVLILGLCGELDLHLEGPQLFSSPHSPRTKKTRRRRCKGKSAKEREGETYNVAPRTDHARNRRLSSRQPQPIPRRTLQRRHIAVHRPRDRRDPLSKDLLHARKEVLGSGETADEDEGVDALLGRFGELDFD